MANDTYSVSAENHLQYMTSLFLTLTDFMLILQLLQNYHLTRPLNLQKPEYAFKVKMTQKNNFYFSCHY